MELLFDEGEIDANETKKFMAKSGSRKSKKKGGSGGSLKFDLGGGSTKTSE